MHILLMQCGFYLLIICMVVPQLMFGMVFNNKMIELYDKKKPIIINWHQELTEFPLVAGLIVPLMFLAGLVAWFHIRGEYEWMSDGQVWAYMLGSGSVWIFTFGFGFFLCIRSVYAQHANYGRAENSKGISSRQ
jgi:hypothetical protein